MGQLSLSATTTEAWVPLSPQVTTREVPVMRSLCITTPTAKKTQHSPQYIYIYIMTNHDLKESVIDRMNELNRAMSRCELCKRYTVADNICSKLFPCVLRSNGFLQQTLSTNCPRAFYGCLIYSAILHMPAEKRTSLSELTIKYTSFLIAHVRQCRSFL